MGSKSASDIRGEAALLEATKTTDPQAGKTLAAVAKRLRGIAKAIDATPSPIEELAAE